MTFLCLASYEKGHEFLRECRRQGVAVLLLTSLSLKDKARWPEVDEIFYMPDTEHEWNRQDTLKSVSFLARTRAIDRIVAIDDFDVEVAAMLREHLRVPGMGESAARYFRDKLAMRAAARTAGIPVPDFVHVLHHGRVRDFLDRVPPPWVLKPRSMAGAIGIRKIHSAQEFWPIVEALSDMQSYYLLEQFVPGGIFHVDTIVRDRQILFAIASGYGRPPMEVSHEGGVFTTSTLERDSPLAARLLAVNAQVLAALGLVSGVSHTEFIQARQTGEVLFLETSARVGGAHIVELIEAATGLNLWAEWAKLEIAGVSEAYEPPRRRQDYAALLVSLARQEHPDTSAYDDPEIVWRMDQPYHVGLIVKSSSPHRVRELLASYVERVRADFQAYLPPRSMP